MGGDDYDLTCSGADAEQEGQLSPLSCSRVGGVAKGWVLVTVLLIKSRVGADTPGWVAMALA